MFPPNGSYLGLLSYNWNQSCYILPAKLPGTTIAVYIWIWMKVNWNGKKSKWYCYWNKRQNTSPDSPSLPRALVHTGTGQSWYSSDSGRPIMIFRHILESWSHFRKQSYSYPDGSISFCIRASYVWILVDFTKVIINNFYRCPLTNTIKFHTNRLLGQPSPSGMGLHT